MLPALTRLPQLQGLINQRGHFVLQAPRPVGKTTMMIFNFCLLALGRCWMSAEGGLAIANPIDREVLPRVLSVTPQASLPQISPSGLTPAGKLSPEELLEAFLQFRQQHGS